MYSYIDGLINISTINSYNENPLLVYMRVMIFQLKTVRYMLNTGTKHAEIQEFTNLGTIIGPRQPNAAIDELLPVDLVYEAVFQKIGPEIFEIPTNQGKVLQIMCAAGGRSISAEEIQALLGKSFTPGSFRILIWRLSRILKVVPEISFERTPKGRYRLRWIGEYQPAVQDQSRLVLFYSQVKLTFREIVWQDHKIYLHQTPYTILRYLFAHPEQVVESNILLDLMGALHNNLPDKRTLDCHIFWIRSMLSGFKLTLTTVRRVGFILHKNEVEDTASIVEQYEAIIGRKIYKSKNQPRQPGKIIGKHKGRITKTYTAVEHSALLRAMEQTLRDKLANTRTRFIQLKEILPPGTDIANHQVRDAAMQVIESYIAGSYLYPFGGSYYAKSITKLGDSYFDVVGSNLIFERMHQAPA